MTRNQQHFKSSAVQFKAARLSWKQQFKRRIGLQAAVFLHQLVQKIGFDIGVTGSVGFTSSLGNRIAPTFGATGMSSVAIPALDNETGEDPLEEAEEEFVPQTPILIFVPLQPARVGTPMELLIPAHKHTSMDVEESKLSVMRVGDEGLCHTDIDKDEYLQDGGAQF